MLHKYFSNAILQQKIALVNHIFNKIYTFCNIALIVEMELKNLILQKNFSWIYIGVHIIFFKFKWLRQVPPCSYRFGLRSAPVGAKPTSPGRHAPPNGRTSGRASTPVCTAARRAYIVKHAGVQRIWLKQYGNREKFLQPDRKTAKSSCAEFCYTV